MPKNTNDWIKAGWKAALDADIDVLDPEFISYMADYLDDTLFCDIEMAESDVRILKTAIDDALDSRDDDGCRLRDLVSGYVAPIVKIKDILEKALRDTK